MDFVGEKPTNRTKLLAMDVLVLVLQLIYLALFYKKDALEGSGKAETPAQDLESEEAGVSRAAESDLEGDLEQGVEMQDLLPDGSGRAQVMSREGDDVVVLRRQDFRRIFYAPPAPGPTEEQRNAMRRLLQRLAERARRAGS